MTTSGTFSFSRNRDQLIGDALLLAGVTDENETPSSNMVSKANVSLNAMVKHWQGTGLYIWTMTEGILLLTAGQYRYPLTSGFSTNYRETALSADAASGATSISVDSIVGAASGNGIAILKSDGTIFFSTVNGAPSGSTIALLTALDGAASDNAFVITYTQTVVSRILEIVSARRYNLTSKIDTPIDVVAREEFFDLPLKTGTGVPNILFYDRRGGANAAGDIYFWQPETTNPPDAIKFTWKRPIQDFNVAADDPDLPQEWIETITYNLAQRLAMSYGNIQRLKLIAPEAARMLAEMRWNERELETIEFAPDYRNMRR